LVQWRLSIRVLTWIRWGRLTTIYFDFVSGSVGGQNYDNLSIRAANLYSPTFTFPTNGQFFMVSVPATLGLVVVEGCGDGGGCTTYNLTSKPGKLVLSFTYFQGSYYANSGYFATVPEPGTFGLMAIGISAFVLRKRKLMRVSG
jgi:hypothetical protein